ncbi:nucleotidyl transferase AbiEii/AbiGii toxin family protein [Thermodesulfobacteriota bacterium B35]
MNIEVLDSAQQGILPGLAEAFRETTLYMAGGTALALQVGHRPSVDFDWFGSRICEPETLYRRLQDAGLEYVVLSESFETIYVEVEGVQVSIIGYRYPLLSPFNRWREYDLRLAGLDDIACMKLSAIANRGSRKDFIDLHYLVCRFRTLKDYLELFRKKFRQQDVGHVVRSLVYFEDADKEPEIDLYFPLDWQNLKHDFESWIRQLSG